MVVPVSSWFWVFLLDGNCAHLWRALNKYAPAVSAAAPTVAGLVLKNTI